MACKDYHGHASDMAFRRVIDYEGGTTRLNSDGTVATDAFAYHISLACNHCSRPVCVRVCPTGAMHRDDVGLVWPDAKRCIGCGYCTMACPYHAPHIDPELKRSSKCDGCTARVTEGRTPVCVEACPVRALEFGDIDDLHAAHEDSAPCIMPLPAFEATEPNLLIKASEAAKRAEDGSGRIANREELHL